MTSVVVFDYGFGNVRSMVRALANLDLDVTLTSDHRQALEADGLVVPGVGAFGACMEGLKSVGGDRVIKDRLRAGRPVLGVCVGEQIMFERGMEHGDGTPGLGLIKGDVELLDADVPIDTDRRIEALTNEEIRIQRIAAGNTGSDILQQVHTPRRLDRRGTGHTGTQQPFTDAQKPPLERAKARYAIGQAAAEPASEPQHRGGSVAGILLIALLFLLLLWVLSGMMMSLGWIPRLDLGYTWFDRTVFCLFDLA